MVLRIQKQHTNTTEVLATKVLSTEYKDEWDRIYEEMTGQGRVAQSAYLNTLDAEAAIKDCRRQGSSSSSCWTRDSCQAKMKFQRPLRKNVKVWSC